MSPEEMEALVEWAEKVSVGSLTDCLRKVRNGLAVGSGDILPVVKAMRTCFILGLASCAGAPLISPDGWLNLLAEWEEHKKWKGLDFSKEKKTPNLTIAHIELARAEDFRRRPTKKKTPNLVDELQGLATGADKPGMQDEKFNPELIPDCLRESCSLKARSGYCYCSMDCCDLDTGLKTVEPAATVCDSCSKLRPTAHFKEGICASCDWTKHPECLNCGNNKEELSSRGYCEGCQLNGYPHAGHGYCWGCLKGFEFSEVDTLKDLGLGRVTSFRYLCEPCKAAIKEVL